jgi:hypothetical protein
MPGTYPEEIVQHSEHGESLKFCGFVALERHSFADPNLLAKKMPCTHQQ